MGLELEDDREGARVVRVMVGSPAAEAGIQKGDVVLRVGKQSVSTAADVAPSVRLHPPGESIDVHLARSGERQQVEVKLASAPHPEDLIRFQLVGQRAPEISGVVAFQGDVASLKDVQGRVLLLEFWASYCGACRGMARVLGDWYRQKSGQGLVVVGVTSDTALRGARVAAATNMMYPLVSDVEAQVARDYGAREIPLLVVVDRRGIVRDVVLGYDTGRLEETAQLVSGLLAEAP